MTRKLSMATKDDQTRRFAVDDGATSMAAAIQTLRQALWHCRTPGDGAALLRHIDAIERLIH